jgi:hypothetical protein
MIQKFAPDLTLMTVKLLGSFRLLMRLSIIQVKSFGGSGTISVWGSKMGMGYGKMGLALMTWSLQGSFVCLQITK